MPKLRIKITGKVQGVFFRQTAKHQAKTRNICGWITNLPDSSVLCEAYGEQQQLLDFVNWCKQGPPRAQVEQTIVEWLDDNSPTFDSPDFQITG